MKLILAIFLTLSLSACHTVYFVKGDSVAIETTNKHWHHGGGIFGLFEFSEPYDPSKTCENGWEAVKTDHTFLTAFVTGLVPYGIYTPWEVSARCI